MGADISRRDFLRLSLATMLTSAFGEPSVPYITKGSRDSNKVALTFDDGWDRVAISELTDICHRYDLKVSVFAVSSYFSRFPDLWEGLQEAGVPIYNHTTDHTKLDDPGQDFDKYIGGWEKDYEEMDFPEQKIKLFRPPHLIGLKNIEMYSWLYEHDYSAIVGCSLDPKDYEKERTKKQIYDYSIRMGGGGIVMMHLLTRTMELLPKIVNHGRRHGLEFVTLTELPGTPFYQNETPIEKTERRVYEFDKIMSDLYRKILEDVNIP